MSLYTVKIQVGAHYTARQAEEKPGFQLHADNADGALKEAKKLLHARIEKMEGELVLRSVGFHADRVLVAIITPPPPQDSGQLPGTQRSIRD